jgi:hypothetical protein
VLLVQPAGHFGAPDWAPGAHQAFFDDHDLVALALRALNAQAGRRAGRLDEPDWPEPEVYARRLRQEQALQERYYLEYPHAALLIFRLGLVWQGPLPPVPAALADGHYLSIILHRPRDEAERELWRRLRWAVRVYVCLMVLCHLALVLLLRGGYERGGALASTGVLLILPAALYFTLHRFDIVPALLTALGVACLGRRWWASSGAFLAAAALVKVYPVLLVPLVLRYLGPTRQGWRWLGAFALTVVLVLAPSLVADGWQGVWAPYRIQLTRAPEWAPPTIYGTLLPTALAENTPLGRAFRLGCLLLVLAAVLWRRPPDLAAVLRRAAVVLIVFVSLAVFYSPQWVLWLAPLLLPLATRNSALFWLAATLDLVTYLTWPLNPTGPLTPALTAARFALLAGIVLVLVRQEWIPRDSALGEGTAGGV